MPITAEQLAKLSPLAKVKKTATVKTAVDLLKMGNAVADAATALVSGEGDPDAKVTAFADRIDSISDVLEKAVEGEDGSIYLEDVDAEVAKEFAPTAETEVEGTEGTGSDEDVAKNITLAKGLSDDEIDENLEDGEWPEDLSPGSSATIMRNARLTKGQRPVPARPGARGRVQKRFGSARDEAFGRGGSDRCME